MRIASFDGDRVGIVDGDTIVELTSTTDGGDNRISAMRSLIKDRGTQAPPDIERGAAVPLSAVQLGPPVPDPSKIFAAQVNYRDHQAEMNEAHQVSGLGLFLKAPSSLVGCEGSVVLPYHDRRFDQEGELAVVIGRQARNVTVDRALDYVFGFTALLEITMRGGEDRSTRKSFDTFAPIGPWLVTADEFGDVTNGSAVLGQRRTAAACQHPRSHLECGGACCLRLVCRDAAARGHHQYRDTSGSGSDTRW